MKERTINHFEGVNRGVGHHLLVPGELTECLNMYTDRIGEKRRRPGYATLLNAPDANKVRSLFYFEKSNATVKRLLRVSGTKIYAYPFSGSTWGTAVHTLTDSTNPVAFAPLAGKVFITNGVDTCQVYDGTTFTAVASAPKGRWAVVYQRRVYTWGVEGNPDRVYYCALDDPTGWSIIMNSPDAAGYWDVDPDNYGNLVGGAVINRKLTVFKENKIYQFDGGLAAWDELNSAEGLQSQAALLQIENLIYYPNRNAIYAMSETPIPISDFVKDYYEGVTDFNPLTQALCAGRWGRHYLLSVGTITDRDGNTYTNAVLCYNQRINQWFLWTFTNKPTAWTVYVDTSGIEQLCFGDASGNTYLFDSGGLDVATPIASHIVVPLSTDIHQQIELKYLTVVAKPAAGVRVDFSFANDDWKPLGGLKGHITRLMFPDGARGVLPKIKLSDGGSSNYSIQAVHLGYDEVPGEWYKQ